MIICETTDISQYFVETLTNGELSSIIISTAIMVIAIVVVLQIIGRLIGKAEYVELSKAELLQLFLSFLLIVLTPLFFYFFSIIFCASLDSLIANSNLNSNLPCLNANSISDFALCSLREAVIQTESDIKYFMQKNIQTLRDSRIMRTYYFIFKGSTTVGSSTHKAAYAIQYDIMNNLVLLPSLVSPRLQEVALSYGLPLALLTLLPLGILFRMIRPIRDMGNAMYSIGFAIFTLLPVLYAFNGLMYLYLKDSCDNYSNYIADYEFGKNCDSIGFWDGGVIAFSAVFLPNLAGVIIAVFINGMYRVLKELG